MKLPLTQNLRAWILATVDFCQPEICEALNLFEFRIFVIIIFFQQVALPFPFLLAACLRLRFSHCLSYVQRLAPRLGGTLGDNSGACLPVTVIADAAFAFNFASIPLCRLAADGISLLSFPCAPTRVLNCPWQVHFPKGRNAKGQKDMAIGPPRTPKQLCAKETAQDSKTASTQPPVQSPETHKFSRASQLLGAARWWRICNESSSAPGFSAKNVVSEQPRQSHLLQGLPALNPDSGFQSDQRSSLDRSQLFEHHKPQPRANFAL